MTNLIHDILLFVQRGISVVGIFIIFTGVLIALCQYLAFLFAGKLTADNAKVNVIRLNLGRILILGLEFIVAADLIATTTTPDYYALGLAAIIVIIRTLLSFSISREIESLSK